MLSHYGKLARKRTLWLAGRQLLLPVDDFTERGTLQDLYRCITHFPEHVTNTTRSFIAALLASLIILVGYTWQKGDGTIEQPHYIGHVDLLGWLNQVVTTTFTFFTAEDAGIAQIQQDALQEFLRNMLCFGYLRNQDRAFFIPAPQVYQSVDGIFCLLAQHPSKIPTINRLQDNASVRPAPGADVLYANIGSLKNEREHLAELPFDIPKTRD